MFSSVKVTRSNNTVWIEVTGDKRKSVKKQLKEEISLFTDEKVEFEIMPKIICASVFWGVIPINTRFIGHATFEVPPDIPLQAA